MATPATSPPHVIVPAPIATEDTQHVCFICLQNEVDTPDATWVSPCPCSLEAHEGCMLQWVAEVEQSGRTRAGLKCPACRARIYIDQPYDPIVVFRNRVYRRYSRITPWILLTLVSGGTVIGMASYGLGALSVFAGPEAADRWLGMGLLTGIRRRTMMPRTWATTLAKVASLAAIGPYLVTLRVLPTVLGMTTFTVATIFQAAGLVARESLPIWPPSPELAITLMPCALLSYGYLYHGLFGPMERRFNRMLLGRPPVEEPAPVPEDGAAPPAEAAAQHPDEEDEGVVANLIALGQAVRGLFQDVPEEGGERAVEAQVDFEIRIGDDEVDQREADIVAEPEQEEEPLPAVDQQEFELLEDQDDDTDAEGEEAEQVQEQEIQLPLQPAAPEAQEPVAQPNRNRNHNRDRERPRNRNRQRRNNQNNEAAGNNNNGNIADDVLPLGIFSLIVNSVVSSLMLPVVSYGTGELLRLALPASWTLTPKRFYRPTGLLQERWGRSLAGGCLFVVLRDAFALYLKYRRVQVKLSRRIRNVDKKAARAAAATTTTV